MIGIFCLHCDEIIALEKNQSITIEEYKITKKKFKPNNSCEDCGFYDACDKINAGEDICDGGNFLYKVEVK